MMYSAHLYELWHDKPLLVASAYGEDMDVVEREIQHEAMMYGQDGPVRVRRRGYKIKSPHEQKPKTAIND